MQLELQTGTTEVVTNLILNHKVDIAFISGVPKSEELIVLNRFNEKIVLLEPKDDVVPNVILSFKKGCAYNDHLTKYYSKDGVCTHKNFEFGSLETILTCVKAGMGRALLPLKVVEKLGFSNDIKITEIKELKNIPTTLVCRKDYIPKISEYLKDIKL
jgi:LysR family transcriptional regulator, cell division regulator